MKGFSELPEGVIHRILGFLWKDDAVKASMCCKAWYSAWLSFPNLVFAFKQTQGIYQIVEATLQRYHRERIGIHEFSLISLPIIKDDPQLASMVNECIRIAIRNGVWILDLHLFATKRHVFPREIFQARSLRELSLSGMNGMELEQPIDANVRFNHLTKLHLCYICLDDSMFRVIIAKCPLVEDLKVDACEGLLRVELTGLKYLREFTVRTYRDPLSVQVEAPNLEVFDCTLMQTSKESSLDLSTTEKLKRLSLACYPPVPKVVDDDFGKKFPRVEYLTLKEFGGREKIKISSHSLKHLVLEDTKKLKEVRIDAPNMTSLELQDYHFSVSLDNPPTQWGLKMYSGVSCNRVIDQFCKLKQFLANLCPSKISLRLFCIILDRIKDVSDIPVTPVFEVEELKLSFCSSPRVERSKFFDALFLTCHPKVIMFESAWSERKVIKLLYKMLIEARWKHKSWYPDLKEAEFEVPALDDFNRGKWHWHPSSLKDFMDLQGYYRKVRFRLEWESHLLSW